MVEQYNLTEAIDEHLDSKQNEPRERDYFYVSELGKSKKAIYDTIVNKKPFIADARVKRILDNGNYMHERYTKLFAEMGILCATEINLGDDLVHGRLDCLITDKKQNYIVELKSCSMWTFNKLTKPSTPHMLQIQFYMYYMNIPRGFVLYENKNDQMIKCFYIELDKELVENKINELKELKVLINKKEEPKDVPFDATSLQYD